MSTKAERSQPLCVGVRVCLSFLPTLNNFLICWSIGQSDLTEGKSLQE